MVTHDLAVARALCHRVTVMERGRIVETQASGDLARSPLSEAGRALVAASG